jgi:hypothetical protein
MEEATESIGAALTGAPVARTIEPGSGNGRSVGAEACRNCATPLVGRHCYECGQAVHVHRTISALFHDLLHGVLHFEGKIWRTLPLLAWHPGQLTRRYIDGERARFVSPMAVFLFSVFLMFAVFSAIGGPFQTVYPEELRSTRAEVASVVTKERKELARLQQGWAEELRMGHADHAARFEREITKVRQAINVLESISRIRDEEGITRVRAPVGEKWLNTTVEKFKSNPSLAIQKLQNNAYKLSWLLIPLSLPFLWLLFPFSQKFNVYDHAVFVTYSLSFITLLVVALSLVVMVVPKGDWVTIALAFIPPVHMYRQLRSTYELSRTNALWRAVLLVLFQAIVLMLFVLLLTVLAG